MICVISFHFCLIARHLDIVRYFIFAFVYCETSGRSLKQEGVYVTSRSCVHPDVTYSCGHLCASDLVHYMID
jgi:hypothetical protein